MAPSCLLLLREPDHALREYALRSLNEQVDKIWPDVAGYVSQLEELYEDASFGAQGLAALVVSKVYYNLGEYEQSVRFALAAQEELDLGNPSEYVNTIVSNAISIYIRQRELLIDHNQPNEAPEPNLEKVVEKMLQRCVLQGNVAHALGIALDARRLDLVEEIVENQPTNETVQFVIDCSVQVVANRSFRTDVLAKMDDILKTKIKAPEYMLLVKIIIQLADHERAIALFEELFKHEKAALALQIAFVLVVTASQELLAKTARHFAASPKIAHARLCRVLSGVPTCDYELTFLKRHLRRNSGALQRTKAALDGRVSVYHSALTFQNAFAHVGTTEDTFLRSNIDWLSLATNWTKFSATAALGVIHRGNLSQGRRILQPYLPGGQGSAHSRGGSLYGLGLLFAGFGAEVLPYLQGIIRDMDEADAVAEEQDVVLHGACLGVALSAMRTRNLDVYDSLRRVLFKDSAIAGEAAGLAMGVVMLGSKSPAEEAEMLQYARDTQHEKIIRSLAIGIALINYGREEGSDELIATLVGEQDAILRYGGCFTIALAYAGTGNNKAIKQLLHLAVSDASDDVRRAAVMGLGFIQLRNPATLPRMVQLLAESHNPHVRYGTTMALGVACAGTVLPEAIEVLLPMLTDTVDFVRQGAMMALALMLIQQNETSPYVKHVREKLQAVIADKHEDSLAKFGAALAQGIIDAGGANVTIMPEHKLTGNLNMKAICGLAVFLQYWYWYPLVHFLSLAFTPTTVIGVREDLKIPEFSISCSGSKKLFDYLPVPKESSQRTPEKLITAILSTTFKDKRREKKEKKDDPKDEMHVDEHKEKEEQDSSPYDIPNMSRVVPWQRKYVSFKDDRFVPVLNRDAPNGIIVLEDRTPAEPYEVIKTVRQASSKEDEQDEAPLPARFIYPPSQTEGM